MGLQRKVLGVEQARDCENYPASADHSGETPVCVEILRISGSRVPIDSVRFISSRASPSRPVLKSASESAAHVRTSRRRAYSLRAISSASTGLAPGPARYMTSSTLALSVPEMHSLA